MKQLDLFEQLVQEAEQFTKHEQPVLVNIKRKQGRPKGSKNKNKRGVSLSGKTPGLHPGIGGSSPPPSTKKREPVPERMVEITVNPAINHNGHQYAGPCVVLESIANELRYMMEQHYKGVAKTTQYIDHPAINLGEV